jgi:hypothetical protein
LTSQNLIPIILIVFVTTYLGGLIMNKADLVAKVADKTGFKKKDAEMALDAVLETIEEALVAGDSVRLIGFGTF